MTLDIHPELPDDSVPVRKENIGIKQLPCCLYLTDPDGKPIVKLNDSSSLIWSLCNGEFSVGAMIELLRDSFPDAADVIAKDVYRVLDEFKEQDVITLG